MAQKEDALKTYMKGQWRWYQGVIEDRPLRWRADPIGWYERYGQFGTGRKFKDGGNVAAAGPTRVGWEPRLYD